MKLRSILPVNLSVRQENERDIMGVMADSMAEYAQPLLDETDGSIEQVQNAFAIAQMCWNLALLQEEEQEDLLAHMRPELKLNDTEFADFRETVVVPMIRRHNEMFPNMPRLNSKTTTPLPKEKMYSGTGRNAPCPCSSGKKYKRCCGK